MGSLRLFTITAYIAFGASMTALAEPLCSSLFETPSVRFSESESLVDELAKLKMELDQAQARGEVANSPLMKVVHTAFKTKLEKLRQATGLSDMEIKQVISQRIQPLQKQETQNHEKITSAREEHIKSSQIFIHRASVKLRPVGTFKDLSYIPELNRLSIYADDGPRLYSLEDGKMEFTLIGNTRGFKVLPDLKHGLAIQPLKASVNLYKMGQREALETFPTDIVFADGASIEFSPTSKQALLTEFFGRAHLLSLNAKQFTTITMPGTLSYSYSKRRGYFVNETVILITSETNIARVELTTGKFIEREIFTNEQHQAVISEDRKTILVYTSKKMIALNAETLEAIAPAVDFEPQRKSIEEVIKVPGTNRLYVRLKDPVTLEHSFATDIEVPQFEFQNPFPLGKNIRQITLSSDGGEAFVLHKGDNDKFFTVEHWKR